MSKSTKFSARVDILETIIILLEKIKTHLRYNRTPTVELIKNLFEYKCFKSIDFLNKCIKDLESNLDFPKVWENSVLTSSMPISDSDKKILADLSDILGSRDLEGQLSGIDLTISMIDENLKEARLIKDTQGKLYRNLGVLSGLGITILIL